MLLTLKDLPLQGRRVVMRVDFNVPLNALGEIMDDSRIRASIPSIEYILKQGASLVLMSHLGRPQGKKEPRDSLAPCAQRLRELLGRPVQMASGSVGVEVEQQVAHLAAGQVLLLENLRFSPAEENPSVDPSFAKTLASYGDFYVDDAFAAAHRAHASIVDVARFFPGKAAVGFLMQQEVTALSALLKEPQRPFYAILGGAKISTKLGVLQALLHRVDALFLGGGMVFTLLKSQGLEVGRSLVSLDHLEAARALVQAAIAQKVPLFLPADFVVARAFQQDAESFVVSQEAIPQEAFGMDIGPKTVQIWMAQLQKAATIFWNGPLGVYEMDPFAQGTRAIADGLAHLPASVVVGGGDSVAAIQTMGFSRSFAHLSTGGGASLEFLESGHLPGLDVLLVSLGS